MPAYEHIILDKDPAEHIARLTINRPQRRNALHDAATDEMAQAIANVASDDDIRVLVLTGAGQAFCAGADLDGLKGGRNPGFLVSENTDNIRPGFQLAQRMVLDLQRMEKPVIAMINGTAVGPDSTWPAPATSASLLPKPGSWWPTSGSVCSQVSAALGSIPGPWAAWARRQKCCSPAISWRPTKPTGWAS